MLPQTPSVTHIEEVTPHIWLFYYKEIAIFFGSSFFFPPLFFLFFSSFLSDSRPLKERNKNSAVLFLICKICWVD